MNWLWDRVRKEKPKSRGGMTGEQRLEDLYLLAKAEGKTSLALTRDEFTEWLMPSAVALLANGTLEATGGFVKRDDQGRIVAGYYRGMPIVEVVE